MDKVTVKKDDLLAALRTNREAHRDIFEEASAARALGAS